MMQDKQKVQEPQPQPQKVTARLSISCGCGFMAKTSKEAQEHALKTDHVLTVHGTIGRVIKVQKARLV
jgi:predicted small metal-binding protein